MVKHLVAAAVAAALWVPEAAAQSILQKSDWQDRSFNSYLPVPVTSVPWLNLDRRTTLPKGDLPIGQPATPVGSRIIPAPMAADIQVLSNNPSDLWRM